MELNWKKQMEQFFCSMNSVVFSHLPFIVQQITVYTSIDETLYGKSGDGDGDAPEHSLEVSVVYDAYGDVGYGGEVNDYAVAKLVVIN